MVKVYIPNDMCSVALGADEVAGALAIEAAKRSLPIEIVRNGSRGLFTIEPLVEVQTAEGRIGYGPVYPEDVRPWSPPACSTAPPRQAHRQAEEHPFFKGQTRLTFVRNGITDPLDFDDYVAHGGMKGLAKAIEIGPKAIVEEVFQSGLRGRGGAGFPTGIKWKTVNEYVPAGNWNGQKYIVCNADEGDSATFADRMVMEGDPFQLIEGMAIAGIAVGATKGFVYIRSEYPFAVEHMEKAIATARRRGLLGRKIGGSDYSYDMEVRVGAGAYVCGEETSLLESLEGKRGLVRAKPPLPAHKGLFGQPTVINNVLSLAAVPYILSEAPPPTRTTAWAVRGAPCRSSWPATSSGAGSTRPPSASRSANWST
ncbi:MAG: hypothetical protein WDN45_13475 [Caulobacteraceae bacterium]